jgi:fructuronate reductase
VSGLSGAASPARPERIVHLGVGAFFRAHQAWYTQHATDAADWGIVGYTGRSATVADELKPQGCKYHLITRGESGDQIELIESLVRVEDGANVANLVATLADPTIAIVTLTITEAGYRVTPDFALDTKDPEVAHDLLVLAGSETGAPTTAMGRLALALNARRLAGSGPIAIVPCDNMPANGRVAKAALTGFGAVLGVEYLRYLNSQVSFVTTSIDRITPKTTDAEKQLVVEFAGWNDASPVVTEPFSDWVLEGEFPAGRPAWESAGARFVSEIEPFENRKLWLLNGAHSLLAYAGLNRGHQTVAEAIGDAELLAQVEAFWDTACEHLSQHPAAGALDLPAYRAALLERFRNGRIRHNLAQIANDGATKLRVRIAPTASATANAGAAPAFAIGNWVKWILGGVSYIDSRSADIEAAKSAADSARALVQIIDANLAANQDFMSQIRAVQ